MTHNDSTTIQTAGHNPSDQEATPRCISELNPQELRVLQHWIIATLLRSPLQSKLNINNLLKLVTPTKRTGPTHVGIANELGRNLSVWLRGEEDVPFIKYRARFD